MIPIRRAVVTSLAIAALAVGAPVASAGAADDPTATLAPCGTTLGPEGQGGTAGTENHVCIGSGVATIGPSIGQIATLVGPTITGGPVGSVIVAAGNAAG
jgi:hypothetical protein